MIAWLVLQTQKNDQIELPFRGYLPIPFERKVFTLKEFRIIADSREYSPASEKLLHPRHTNAYISLLDFTSWHASSFPARAESISVKFDEPALKSKPPVDEDGNTYLNRLLLSHFLLEKPYAVATFYAMKKRGMISMAPNKFGQTPLMLAIESGWAEPLKDILEAKPDFEAKDNEGRTAIDYLRFMSGYFSGEEYAREPEKNAKAVFDLLRPHIPEQQRRKFRGIVAAWQPLDGYMKCGDDGRDSGPSYSWPPPSAIYRKGGG